MAQQWQALRCCSCEVFQVQQVKKSKKWNCKICNEKQSVLKVFGQGSASDCRRHVQKLNLLQGEREQTPMNIPRYIEEPIQMGNENTVVNLEEKLDWQKEKFQTMSRWTKYLDGRCEEQEKEDGEEEMVLTEKQICSSNGKTEKHPRKLKKTSLCFTDVQGLMEPSVSSLADNVESFENNPDSVTAYPRICDVPCEMVSSPAVEGQLLHRSDKDPGSKGAGFPKWEKFLLSGKSCKRGGPRDMLEEIHRQPSGTGVRRGERAVTSISTSAWNQPHPLEQNTWLLGERVPEVPTIDHVPVANLPVERSQRTLGLASTPFQERLLKRLSKETSYVPSKRPLAASNSNTLHVNLFSTDDDFDDDI